jgi:hypothetical protein
MAALYEEKKVKRQTGVRKVQKKKGIFSSAIVEVDEPIYEEVIEKVPTGKHSDTYINIDDFARRMTDACNDLHEKGYDVIKITEVIEGRYNYAYDKYGTGFNGAAPTCYSYGYGYSVTDGVVILAKKRESSQGA